jgi:tol-pal system protein YbgF
MILNLLMACVLDRTGQSATDQMHQELKDHDHQIDELSDITTDASRRISQMEEVTRTLGRDQLDRLETMDALRTEVAALRGTVDEIQHDYTANREAGTTFQTDTDARILYLEARVASLEQKLGIKPPPPGSDVASNTSPEGGTSNTLTPPAPAAPSTPDEIFTLIQKNIEDGQTQAARVVAQDFITQNPKSERVSEAYYRIAQAWQKEGQFKDAAAAYQLVVDKYKDSPWAPWAMLRQGECFESLGRKDAAKVFWEDLVRLYPKSKPAKEAKAKLAK